MPMGCALGNMRCLVAVMLACAVAVAPARAQPSPASPVSSIRVTGDAKVTARPDRVQIDIGVSTRAAQSQEAAEQNARSEEHTSELRHSQISYAVFCLKKKNNTRQHTAIAGD